MKICLYVCIYGNYDALQKQIKQDIEMDYLCFTDNTDIKNFDDEHLFKIIKYIPLDDFKDKPNFNPINYNIINTHLARTNLFLLEPLKKYDIVIYLDANAKLTKPNVISNILKSVDINKCDLIISKHPWRNCIYDEMIASQDKNNFFVQKYENTDFNTMANKYLSLNYPKKNGLYWTGFIFYLHPFESYMKIFYDTFLKEKLNYIKDITKYYHPHCQSILPFVLHALKMDYHVIPPYFYCNNGIEIVHHLRYFKK